MILLVVCIAIQWILTEKDPVKQILVYLYRNNYHDKVVHMKTW